ncbi:hypothetical protein [Listeria booriae]|uniref:hypothetical protein n=1 Tax=Listeria booriae TaxID=1552123 RepID=UPI0016250128|nr:hypothetical protein [Listeria booriae]MBC2392232.1 hypothetical protein [Listeria booriae]
MNIDSFISELAYIMKEYEEDFHCELSFARLDNISFDEFEKQECDEPKWKYFTDYEYIKQIEVLEDYFEGTIIREIKGSDYCVLINFST